MADLLRIDYINSLPQPFMVMLLGGSEWPLIDICVDTGLLRVDVCGMIDRHQIGDVVYFTDADGYKHDVDTFYSDYEDSDAKKHFTPERDQDE